MKIAPSDIVRMNVIIAQLATAQVELDAIRARLPRCEANSRDRLALAIAIVNLERTESTLRDVTSP